jgi:hypothetical protein
MIDTLIHLQLTLLHWLPLSYGNVSCGGVWLGARRTRIQTPPRDRTRPNRRCLLLFLALHQLVVQAVRYSLLLLSLLPPKLMMIRLLLHSELVAVIIAGVAVRAKASHHLQLVGTDGVAAVTVDAGGGSEEIVAGIQAKFF